MKVVELLFEDKKKCPRIAWKIILQINYFCVDIKLEAMATLIKGEIWSQTALKN